MKSLMNEKYKIIDKIKKLFALSKSNNENEAFFALQKATELMQQFNLEYKDVYITEKSPTTRSRRVSKWRNMIGSSIATLNGVLFLKSFNTYLFTGSDLEVEISCEMYDYLEKSILRITRNSVRKNTKHKYRESFKLGMAYHLDQRITELGKKTSWLPDREERINNLLEALKSNIRPYKKTKKKSSLNQLALNNGIKAAENINLNLQMNTTAEKQKMIKAG
jgi:uncharacterized protein DUF2786